MNINVGSFTELFSKLDDILIKSLEIYGDQIKDKMKENIDKDVYQAGSPEVYQRSYELKESVIRTEPERIGNEISITIEHNTNLMSLDAEHFIHGNAWASNGDDFRENLPWAINNGELGGENGVKFGRWFGTGKWYSAARPYYDDTVADVVQNGASEFKNIVRKNGLNIF